MIRPAPCIKWMRQYAGEGPAGWDMNTATRSYSGSTRR